MEDLELPDSQLRRLARFPNFHHSSPLVYYPQRHIVRIYSGLSDVPVIPLFDKTLSNIRSLNRRRASPYQLTDDPGRVYYHVLSLSNSCGGRYSPHQDGERFQMCSRLALKELFSELQAIKNAHPALAQTFSNPSITDSSLMTICGKLSTITKLRCEMVNVRNTVQILHVQSDDSLKGPLHVGDMQVYIQKELLLIDETGGGETLTLLNYDQWLMLTDTVCCRLMTRLTCYLNDEATLDNLPSSETVEWVYRWGDDIIRACGVAGYALIGEFESLVTGVFVNYTDSDPLGLGVEFMHSLHVTAEENYRQHGIPVHFTTKLLNYLKGFASVNILSELFGLRKHWGNPMVDAACSGKAVQDRLNEDLPISGTHVINLLSSFNRMITLEFIHQHGEWPKCEFFTGGEDFPLLRAWRARTTRIPETDPDHKHVHWSLLRFHCNCVIEGFEDQLSLLSDKSVSVYREHLDAIYVQSLCAPSLRVRPEENRRLLLEFLRKEHLGVLDIFKIIMTGTVPVSWLANSASMKGTEMKHEKARIFAVLTFELRQYFAATEEILKTHLFRYNPHQTMTMSEVELLSKLRSVTRQMDPANDSRFLCVMHIIDFSKWNLRMKYDNTCLVFKSIDNFLGMPGLIEQTHLLFADMVNIVQDPFNPPRNGVSTTESDTIWRNHIAGWEGQRQKGWTLLTSALLSDIERLTGVHSTICGQGDNQTLLSYFPVPETYRGPLEWIDNDPEGIRSLIDTYYSKLERECTAVGLKVKTAESCRSLTYFNYGKRLYFRGVELSMTLKRISKTITEPNGTYPITELILKTEEGSSYGAGLHSHPSVWPFVIGRLSTYLTLMDSFLNNPLCGNFGQTHLRSRGLEFNGRFLSVLAKIPSSLGGPPQLPFSSFLYRGHPDPTCSDFVMLVLKARNGCLICRKILSLAYQGDWFNSHVLDKKSLIAAPFSLNLKMPLSARIPLEREVLPALMANCSNPDISPLFSTSLTDYDHQLISHLSTMLPFHPLVANDIYSRTLPGRRQSFISGLTNTTSLGRLVYESRVSPIVNKIVILEQEQLKYWGSLVMDIITKSDHYNEISSLAHHEIVQHCRDISWGCTITGVTVPHPLEQFKLVLANHDVCNDECTSCKEEHLLFTRHSEGLIKLPGLDGIHVATQRSRNSLPYLGSNISEGITQRYVSCLNPTPAWKDSIRLNIIRRWISSDGEPFDQFLKSIIRTRTNASQTLLDLASGHPSRLSYSHRAALLSVVKSCNVSSSTNMQSRIYVSSNRMGQYSHGEFNYHLAFGPSFLCMQSLICLGAVLDKGLTWSTVERETFHAHIRRDDVPIVLDTNLSLQEGSELLSLDGRTPIPKLLFTDQNSLSFTSYESRGSNSIWSDFGHASPCQVQLAYSNQLLGESFAMEIVIREQMTSELLGNYAHRENPISVGDISMTGVKRFVRAIAVNMLLMAPTGLFESCQNDPIVFSPCCMQFVETFSPSFWAQFAQPLSVMRNLDEIVSLSRTSSHYALTRTTFGVIKLLKDLIVRDMFDLKTGIRNYLTQQEGVFPFELYAPSTFALRLLWSKAVEVCILSLSSLEKLNLSEAVAFARDFSHNIHSVGLDHLPRVMIQVQSDFTELVRHLRIENISMLPKIECFSLIHPWVDRARNITRTDQTNHIENSVSANVTLSHIGDMISLEFGPDELTRNAPSCDCEPIPRPTSLHTECFFTPTGLLSKSHYKFLDLVLKNNLRVEHMICVGTSTGTEALGFAVLDSCQKIYVNCNFDISRFRPHMAGSYIPAAFVGHPAISKLVAPSSAAMASNDLLKDETVETILTHTESFTYTGVTCDAEMPSNGDIEIYLTLCWNLLKICSHRANPVKWLIVKIPVRCKHQIEHIASLIGQVFTEVIVEYSLYSRPGLGTFYFIAKNPHSRISLLPNCKYKYAHRLSGNINLGDLFERCTNRSLPGIALQPIGHRTNRNILNSFLPSSFPIACGAYVDGLGSCVQQTPSVPEFKISCQNLIKGLSSSAMEYIRTANRTFRSVTMVRSNILQVDTDPVNIALNEIYLKVNRVELLLLLIDQGIPDLLRAEDTCKAWLSEDHSYVFGSRRFRVKIDVTRFFNFYSRYLFEILGHLYSQHYTLVHQGNGIRLFHKNPNLPIYGLTSFVLYPVACTQPRSRPNLRWAWEKRAEVFFYLISIKLLGRHNLRCLMPHPFVLHDLVQELNHEESVFTSNTQNPTEDYDCIWASDDHLPIYYLHNLGARFTMIINVGHLSLLSRSVDIEAVYHLPWTGLIPEKALILGNLMNRAFNSIERFPYFSYHVNRGDPQGYGLVGCGCYDCSIEVQVSREFRVNSSFLDVICSSRRIMTVRDLIH